NLRMVGLLGQLPRPEIMPRADELLRRFDLADAADRPLRTYSGGMRRRLDIAASLVPHPPVLFLDEPTTGLDITSRNELWERIRLSSDEGAKVLVQALRALDGDGLSPDGLTVREPSLDDVFLALTGHHAEDGEPDAVTADAGGRKRGGRR